MPMPSIVRPSIRRGHASTVCFESRRAGLSIFVPYACEERGRGLDATYRELASKNLGIDYSFVLFPSPCVPPFPPAIYVLRPSIVLLCSPNLKARTRRIESARACVHVYRSSRRRRTYRRRAGEPALPSMDRTSPDLSSPYADTTYRELASWAIDAPFSIRGCGEWVRRGLDATNRELASKDLGMQVSCIRLASFSTVCTHVVRRCVVSFVCPTTTPDPHPPSSPSSCIALPSPILTAPTQRFESGGASVYVSPMPFVVVVVASKRRRYVSKAGELGS
ncbi:hypothetical protein SCHPADRAFT_745720 [Schizopora paradoxa]|uniref:Uncharacterized protein n=1 Tax=Schizopora paradoxa TaxID=27342 RepID=A0A0H2QYW3_9AGAM|nr:hypothetical protein SCHPADRAFT_745720 [Schizopora paradoxa]